MEKIDHPSQYISSEFADSLRKLTGSAELAGELLPGQLSIIYKERWFNLFVPKEHGGLALSLPDALKKEEALAWIDGSLGWTVTLCSGAAWFIGFLRPDLASVLFSNEQVCFAGSGQPSGIAQVTKNGYEINGNWKYASGAPHATVFTANCVVEKDGIALQNGDGSPVIDAFLFLKEEVTLHKDWNSIGLIDTASHSFSVKQLQVAAERCFRIDSRFVVSSDPIYHYPFLQFAEATLAVNSSGMAVHFIDLFGSLISEREKQNNYPVARIGLMSQQLEAAQKGLSLFRQEFYDAVYTSWDECVSKKTISKELLEAVSTSSRNLANAARKVTDDLYPYCGLIAATPGSEMNRVWRDVHTASQHPLLNFGIE